MERVNTKQACEGGERQRGEKSSWKELHRDSWVARASLGYSRVVASLAIEYARCVSVIGGMGRAESGDTELGVER